MLSNAAELKQRILGDPAVPGLPRAVEVLLRPAPGRPVYWPGLVEAAGLDEDLRAALLEEAAELAPGEALNDAAAAAARLGLGGVRRVVLTWLLPRVFPPAACRGLDGWAFWRHACVTADFARRLADQAELPEAVDAYAAGLLHDMGKAVLDRLAPEGYRRVIDLGRPETGQVLEAERLEYGADHALAGKWLLEHWRLPRRFVNACWLHHQPPSVLAESPFPARLIELTALADELAHSASGEAGAAVHLSATAEARGAALGLPPEALAALVEGYVRREDALPNAASRVDEPELGHAASTPPVVESAWRIEAQLHHALHAMQLDVGLEDRPEALLDAAARFLRKAWSVRTGALVLLGEGGRTAGTAWLDGARPEPLPPTLVRPAEDGLDAAALLAHLRGSEGNLPIGALYSAPLTWEGETVGHVLIDTRHSLLEEQGAAANEAFQLALRSLGLLLRRTLVLAETRAHSESLANALLRQEESKRQALRKERLAGIGKMAAGAAHEINNPLAAISGRAQILLSRLRDPNDVRAIETIIQQSRRASRILMDLMQFARPADPRLDITQIGFVVHQVVALMRDRLEARGVRIVEDLPENMPRVRLDRHQMEKVFLNLITNAEQAMPHGGVLSLRVRPVREGRGVSVQVADTGGGIPAGVIDHIFEPFFTTRTLGEGTGLGLAVCHGIVESHRGTIAVHNEAGRGATFTITLPAVTEEATPSPAAPPAAHAAAEVVRRGDRRGAGASEAELFGLAQAPPAAAAGERAHPAKAFDERGFHTGRSRGSLLQESDAADAAGGMRIARTSVGDLAIPEDPAGDAGAIGGLPQRASEERPAVILLADRDAQLREVLQSALQHRGYHVRPAVDGLETLAAIMGHPVDLVLLDLDLKGVDGEPLLHQIALRKPRLPVLGLCGLETRIPTDDAETLMAVLEKPFEVQRLFAEIERCLRARRVA